MSAEIKVPPFPESVDEGTLTAWHKQEGDEVEQDEKIADIETDKIVLEVSAPEAGVLSKQLVKEGDTVKSGAVLGKIEAGEGKGKKKSEKKKEDDSETFARKKAEKEDQSNPSDPSDQPDKADTSEPSMSPAVRRMVDEKDLDPRAIEGTGRGGMITKADVVAHLALRAQGRDETESDAKAQPAPKVQESAPSAETQPPATTQSDDGRPEQRVPMTRIRARIAERLVEAQQTAAILTTFNEVNLKPVMDLRSRYKEDFEKAHDVKLGFSSFFVKACVEALKKFPVVNATLDGKDMVYHGYYDIGVAVSTDRGLVVPVLRNADQLSFAEVEKGVVDFAVRARKGQLTIEDLTGGTFSITNGGVFGSMMSTPILNPPQSAILGMHKIQERPMAENGQVVIRPMMYLALSYDHRLIDGREAVQFLVSVKETLEDPARLLLNV